VGAFTIATVNWRLHAWIAKMNDIPLAEVRERISLWAMNIFVGVLCAFVLGLMMVSMRTSCRENAKDAGPNGTAA
jgi:hypothetical protein